MYKGYGTYVKWKRVQLHVAYKYESIQMWLSPLLSNRKANEITNICILSISGTGACLLSRYVAISITQL